MPLFNFRSRADAGEVSVEISPSGTEATVSLPRASAGGLCIREMRLGTALHVASQLADHLGTSVVVIDQGRPFEFMEDTHHAAFGGTALPPVDGSTEYAQKAPLF